MRIGYACQTIGVPGTDYRSCQAKNATDEVLQSLIGQNLTALEKAIDYNIAAGIRLFRITSDLIPFGSSPVNNLDWPTLFTTDLARIGSKIRSCGLRVSMHPGQYTVINSPRTEVVERAVEDLRYHDQVLASLGLDASHKIVLHVGGIYEDKAAALQRFTANWQVLPAAIRDRLVIENDDRSYTIDDVYWLGTKLGIPVVFDNLHHELNQVPGSPPSAAWIRHCRATWQRKDGPQKTHYSQQDSQKKGGAHSETIQVLPFLDYCRLLEQSDLDIMLEVKDKNLSAVKCQLAVNPQPRRSELETEWARYKYTILERSPADYLAIRQLLKDHTAVPVLEFYSLVETALEQAVQTGHAINAASHVWGYFKNVATPRERSQYDKALAILQATGNPASVKKVLKQLSEHYQQPYLMNSLYLYLS